MLSVWNSFHSHSISIHLVLYVSLLLYHTLSFVVGYLDNFDLCLFLAATYMVRTNSRATIILLQEHKLAKKPSTAYVEIL